MSGKIDGSRLLEQVRSWLGRFIRVVNDADLDLLTLWAAHTHVVVETYTSPRLQIDSPMPGSGKTTCLEHLHRLCQRPVMMATVSSPALLTRMLDAGMRTILIDEADRSLNPEKDGVADLLAVINSGYKRGATRPVLVPAQGGQWVAKEMPTFAPVVIAGNNPALPDDTRSRIIRVLLLPDLDGTADESDWELIEDDANQLGMLLGAWADQIREPITACRPVLPDRITGRFREKWSPLRRVAEQAGGRWPAVVDGLAVADREQHDQDKEDGLITEKPAVALLRHIAEQWPKGDGFWPTRDLVATLAQWHPEAWGDNSPYGRTLTVQRLGRMLAQGYKVSSTKNAQDVRGYTLGSLAPAMRRMGITPPNEPSKPSDPAEPSPISTAATAPTVSTVHRRGSVEPSETCGPDPHNCQNTNCQTFNQCAS